MDVVETDRAVALALAMGTSLVLLGLLRAPRCEEPRCASARRFYLAYLVVFFVLQMAACLDINPFSTVAILLLVFVLHLAFISLQLRRRAAPDCACARTAAHRALLGLAVAQAAVILLVVAGSVLMAVEHRARILSR